MLSRNKDSGVCRTFKASRDAQTALLRSRKGLPARPCSKRRPASAASAALAAAASQHHTVVILASALRAHNIHAPHARQHTYPREQLLEPLRPSAILPS
jgi:hypothetical protein